MIWKVVEQKGGHIAALGGHDAIMRPGPGEVLLWEGEATDNSDALRKAGEVVKIELGPHGYRRKRTIVTTSSIRENTREE